MSEKQGKIEWKRLQASNGDSYYGYFNGLQVAYIMDVGLPDEYILNFGDNSKPEYFNAVGLAKGRGEEMLEAWLKSADLAKPSEWISVGWLIEWKRKGQHKSIYVENESKMIQQYGTFKAAGYNKLKATELFKPAPPKQL